MPSIANYLMPSVMVELKTRLGDDFDFRLFQGLEADHFRAVQTNRLDFAIVASGDKRAVEMNLDELKLNYRRDLQGITFLHKIGSRPGPFPELSAFVESPRSFSEDKFYSVLKNLPLAMMHVDRGVANQEYGRAISRLFSRESDERVYDRSGQRYYLPTYRSERHFVLRGYAVGFGHPPKSVYANGHRMIGSHEVIIGTDPGFDSRTIVFFPASALGDHLSRFTPFERERFSIYLRNNWSASTLQGGLTDAAKQCVKVVREICKGTIPTAENLKFDRTGREHFLIHDFISSVHNFDASADLTTETGNRS